MLTCQPPYQGPTVDAVLKQIQDDPPPPIRQLNPQAPAALTAIADHAMARELRDRYASMADVVAELERVAQGKELIGTHGKEQSAPNGKAGGSANKRKALTAAGAVALVGLAAFGISKLNWKHEDKSTVIASPLPQPKYLTVELSDGVTMDFVLIQPGSFNMRSDNRNDNGHLVTLTQPYYIGKYEVTQEQWEKVMGNNPGKFKGAKNPVEQVRWNDCQAFVAKLQEKVPGQTFRLPTEAEWEFACRAGSTSDYCYGDSEGSLAEYAWYDANSNGETNVVGTKKPNAWGLYDMHGNVGEWCADWIGDYPATAVTDPQGSPSGSHRVVRGGYWLRPASRCRAADRDYGLPAAGYHTVGFRLVLSSDPGSVGPISETKDYRDASPNPLPGTAPTESQFFYTVKDGVATIVKYTGPGGDVTIDDKINNLAVTTIGAGAFSGNIKLTGVTIPATVTSIDKEAFSGCTGLLTVTFKGNAPVGDPDSSVFSGNDKATVYYLPGTKGWTGTFGGRPTLLQAQDYNCSVKDGAVTIVKYTGPGGEVKIPEKINGLPVTEIGQKAFFACVKMTRVALPTGLIRLGDYAFDNCAGLTHVEIPSTVTDTGNFTFNRCYGLTRITIPNSVTRIGDHAFSSCTSLPTVTIPDSVTSIGPRAFSFCSSLVDVSIPNSVTSIEGNAFLGCIKLTRVTIPATVTTIGPGPFSGCSALVGITVDEANPAYCSVDGVLFDKKNSILFQCPEGKAGTYKMPVDFTIIGPRSFDNCTKLTGVTIPNSVTAICTNAFAGCTSLSSIHVPASVSRIEAVPFSGCSALTTISVDGENPFYSSADGVLFNKQKTVLIRCPGTKAGNYVIPNGVTAIRVSAFADCPNLTGITIPQTVTEIGIGAFVRCIGLTTITIPARVSQIYNDAFLGCDSLMAIKVDAAHPTYSSSEDGVLFSKDKTKLLRYPPGKVGSYRVPDSVTSHETLAFHGCANLTLIAIPDSVGQIRDTAFKACSGLTRVEIGKGLRSIEKFAFHGCGNLSWVLFSGDAPEGEADPTVFDFAVNVTVCHVPDSKGWGKTFANRPAALWDSKLRFCYTTDKDAATLIGYIGPSGDVVIPDKIGGFPVAGIAESAFQNCTTLTSLTVSEGVKSIMGRAFDGCNGLTKVTLPASVTLLGTFPEGQWNPFVNCPKLASITVEAANPAFSSNAEGILFTKDMTALLAYPGAKAGSYTIPDSVTSVGLAAFEGCSELTEVKIHRGVTALGPYSGGRACNPFQNCPKLLSITVDEANATYSSSADGVVFSKDKSGLVCYPSGKAGAYIVPEGVTHIKEAAFAFCPGLTAVTLPASVTNIYAVAFMNSGELAAVWFKGNSPTNRISNAFQGADKATIYHLPTAKGWGPTYIGRPTAVWDGKAR